MPFAMKDLESLKRNGASVQDIHYNLSNAIQNADSCAAVVRTLDKNTGQFEIVLTGTINRDVLEKPMQR